jgi:hypothetical protein
VLGAQIDRCERSRVHPPEQLTLAQSQRFQLKPLSEAASARDAGCEPTIGA